MDFGFLSMFGVPLLLSLLIARLGSHLVSIDQRALGTFVMILAVPATLFFGVLFLMFGVLGNSR